MNPTIRYILLALGIISIWFTMHQTIRGTNYINSTIGLLIGVVLIGTVVISRYKKKKR